MADRAARCNTKLITALSWSQIIVVILWLGCSHLQGTEALVRVMPSTSSAKEHYYFFVQWSGRRTSTSSQWVSDMVSILYKGNLKPSALQIRTLNDVFDAMTFAFPHTNSATTGQLISKGAAIYAGQVDGQKGLSPVWDTSGPGACAKIAAQTTAYTVPVEVFVSTGDPDLNAAKINAILARNRLALQLCAEANAGAYPYSDHAQAGRNDGASLDIQCPFEVYGPDGCGLRVEFRAP